MLKEKEILIYSTLFAEIASKDQLASMLNVTTKTIENTVKQQSGNIKYSKKRKGYSFAEMMPEYISLENYIKAMGGTIESENVKKDLTSISQTISKDRLIPTKNLSLISQVIIKIQIAINHQCTLKLLYRAIGKSPEVKYVKPLQLVVSNGVHYLAGEYVEKNKVNVGEKRNFAINSILSLEKHEFLFPNENTAGTKATYTAFGEISKEKYAIISLDPSLANFFKREHQFAKEVYDFVSEDADGSVTMRVYYAKEIEVKRFLYQWMPEAAICEDEQPELRERIYAEIDEDFQKFMPSKGGNNV